MVERSYTRPEEPNSFTSMGAIELSSMPMLSVSFLHTRSMMSRFPFSLRSWRPVCTYAEWPIPSMVSAARMMIFIALYP